MQALDLGQLFASMIFTYSQIFSNFSINSILAQIQLIMIIKTVYIVLSSILPIDGIVQTIFSPFVYIHQIFHAHAAKKLNNKYRGDDGNNQTPIRITTSLGKSTWSSSEYSNISFFMSNSSVLTIRDVSYFANSSTVPAFVMLIAIVSVGPLMQQFVFAIIHLYILCGITLCLMPSKADSKLVINYIIIKTEISAWYIINIFIVFILAAGTYAGKYYYLGYYPSFWFVEPLLMGIWSSMCYLLLLGIIIMFTEERKFTTKKRAYYFQNEKLKIDQEQTVIQNSDAIH